MQQYYLTASNVFDYTVCLLRIFCNTFKIKLESVHPKTTHQKKIIASVHAMQTGRQDVFKIWDVIHDILYPDSLQCHSKCTFLNYTETFWSDRLELLPYRKSRYKGKWYFFFLCDIIHKRESCFTFRFFS